MHVSLNVWAMIFGEFEFFGELWLAHYWSFSKRIAHFQFSASLISVGSYFRRVVAK